MESVKDEKKIYEVSNRKYAYLSKGLASLGAVYLGVESMYITNGETGIGWAIIALAIIWNRL